MTHYKAFIEVAKGLGTTQEDLQHADSQLDALLTDLPALSAACEHFAKSTAAFTARRAESKQLLSRMLPSPLKRFELSRIVVALTRDSPVAHPGRQHTRV